jgi:hypothetical protein
MSIVMPGRNEQSTGLLIYGLIPERDKNHSNKCGAGLLTQKIIFRYKVKNMEKKNKWPKINCRGDCLVNTNDF